MSENTENKTQPLPGVMCIPVDAHAIGEFLKANPNAAAESKDDLKCKVLLGELGILEQFTRSKDPSLSVLTFERHGTHWIVGLLWSGYPQPDQNGYRVFCLPKSQIPQRGVQDFVNYVLESYGGCGQEDGVIKMPADWRKRN